MADQFYCTAESIIKAHNGFKLQMTGDEIMTRFQTADEAVQAAQALQPEITRTLSPTDAVVTGELVSLRLRERPY